MGLELVIFIAAILCGIFLYWRESNGNGAYRFLNKLVNSKELQMSAANPKGFVYKRSFLPRLLFIVTLVLFAALIIEFLTPVSVFGSYNGISAFASFAAGTLLGTYLANFIIRTSEAVESQSESLEEKFDDVLEKGKDFIQELKTREPKVVEDAKNEIENEPKVDKPSARDRLKDKGLM